MRLGLHGQEGGGSARPLSELDYRVYLMGVLGRNGEGEQGIRIGRERMLPVIDEVR